MMLHPISISDLKFNPFDAIGKDWYLVTSGTLEHYNTMTASWGTMGIFWGKPVVNTFIRPQRYTHEFLEKNDLYTISFFHEEMRPALQLCGSKSGRDIDKAAATGLKPVAVEDSTTFEQARLVLVCKKLYDYHIDPAHFIGDAKELDARWYPQKDYHHCYFGEIIAVYSE